MNSPKFNQSIYPNKCLFYEDVKQFAKVYFVNAVAVRIRQSFPSPKFPVLWYHNHDSNFLAYDGSTKVSRICLMPVDSCVESCI